ncbi:MAG: transposase zinc-binding domain-containing protein, partial [Proteobacteria bacterium]|nr:transposase zinc-binding domain-containing protein [Pseudomonadota bacterium]
MLVRTVRKYLPRFLEAAASDGQWTVPAFVEQALRDLALCGDFTGGFSHFICDRCNGPRVVPFSCKGRLCASCGARRMNEFAAYAVDRLLPRCDYRQWVL